jgi:hypothetical protein
LDDGGIAFVAGRKKEGAEEAQREKIRFNAHDAAFLMVLQRC